MKIKFFLRPMGVILKEKYLEIDLNDKNLLEAIVQRRQEFRYWQPSNEIINELKNVLNGSNK